MRTWVRKNYVVEEIALDRDLHSFIVMQKGEQDQEIVPDSIEDMELIITDLDAGEDVHGWEDGMGGTIVIK